MKKTLLTLAWLALATPTAQADPGQGCLPQSTDPFLALSVQQSSVKSITCTLTCSTGSHTCTATTCSEFTNGSGARCLSCDGATFACCPSPACSTACRNEYWACRDACPTRDCLGDCQDAYDACLDNC
jgi:hypothetical protein